jgi:tetratricopeptide (TPR) repeat protein
MYRQSIAILHEVGDVVYLSRALKSFGMLERQEGNLDEAARLQEEVVAGYREVGRLLDVAYEGLVLGQTLELSGERDQAVEYYRACLEHGIAADNNILRGTALGHLGELDAARRELQGHSMFLIQLDEWLDERPW